MPKKIPPILEKVSSFMKVSISLAKIRNPITLNLMFFKKSGKTRKIKLIRHYNYGFIHEYEFSPSNTPLIIHGGKQYYKERKRRDFYSKLFMCECLGGFRAQRKDENYSSMEVFPAIENAITSKEDDDELEMPDFNGIEDGLSVDERAERFIEKFYEQINQESSLLLGD